MNLKEAFRFQNKLEELNRQASMILCDEDCVTITKRNFLYKRANPSIENETVTDKPDTEYYEHINDLIRFAMFLLEQREILSDRINRAKRSLDIDLDGEISLNRHRQKLADIYRKMSHLKSSESISYKGGTGYCFNGEGNQVSFRCDVEKVTTINFDRNLAKDYCSKLSAKADRISLEIDKCMITCEVDYEPPFDVNGSFDDIFENFFNS